MEQIPQTMRALVALKYCKPSEFTVEEISVPQIQAPEDVLVRVYYSTISFGEVTQATGSGKYILPADKFPLVIGRGGCGVVAAVGSNVKSLKVGDEVYGFGLKHPMAKTIVEGSRGWSAEYAVITEDLLLVKPRHLAFVDVASPLVQTVTALQITRAAIALNPGAFPNGSLEGKTAFVPAGLGSSTNMAAQVAKNVYGAKKMITTVSTAKTQLVDKYLPGVFDQVVDYQTQDILKEIEKGSVDLMINARPDVKSYLPLMNPENGVIGALLAIPPSRVFVKALGEEAVPYWLRCVLDLAQLWYKWLFWGTNIKMLFVSGNPGAREDLEKAGELIAAGKVKAVYTAVDINDLDAIRKSCEDALSRTGTVGALIVKMC